jgi:hypothetical protein
MNLHRYLQIAAFVAIVAIGFGHEPAAAQQPLTPDSRLPTFQPVDPASRQRMMELEMFGGGDNHPARNALRKAVLDAAASLRVQPCDPDVKARYVKAATDYSRAWLSIVPCVGSRTCSSSDEARLNEAQAAFGTPLDHRVREAMTEAHRSGVIEPGDFPADIVEIVAGMARDPVINPHAAGFIRDGLRNFRGPPICTPVVEK